MSLRLAVVGPGRVGSALARALHEHGVEVLGFLGRSPQSVASALCFAGGGRELDVRDLGRAHVVMFAVGDPELPAVVRACAAAPPRSCSLWLHTSGRHGLEVLSPLANTGARLGCLHPALPFPDAVQGYRNLPSACAVLHGQPRARTLLLALCRRLSMTPLWAEGGDRLLYHAACALAANGLTALRGLVDRLLQQGGGLSPENAATLAASLMRAALAGCDERGAAAALSGPVVRGDADTVAAHLQKLQTSSPSSLPAYRALMQQALVLAASRGLSPDAQSALARVLAGDR